MVRAGTVVILAAGQGKRMRSLRPKVLHEMCGRPMLGYVLDQAAALEPERIVVVVGHGGEEVRAWVERDVRDPRIRFVLQAEQRGTGHAVQVAGPELRSSPGPVIVLYGDMPCLTAESLRALLEVRGSAPAALVTALVRQKRGFGRIVRRDGRLVKIVEERDASAEERGIDEVNVGVYAFDRDALLAALPGLSDQNAQGELYLTDVAALELARGGRVETLALEDEEEAIGINSLDHLAQARSVLQRRILERHLAQGVAIEDPATTFIDWDVEIGPGTRVLPCTVIRRGVRIAAGCEVGPFSHLREGTVLEEGAEIGNFTETKKAWVGAHTKAKHLSYLGDVTIGSRANIGAGTIVANYDGKAKHHTEIGAGAFVGSGTVLIAPCTLGERVTTGGGSVVTRNTSVAAGEVWVGVPARPIHKRKPAGP